MRAARDAGSSPPLDVALAHGTCFVHAQYFFAVCAEGSQPDNRHWAERKRRSVVRFGKSTASLRMKWPEGIPAHFAASEDDVSAIRGRHSLR